MEKNESDDESNVRLLRAYPLLRDLVDRIDTLEQEQWDLVDRIDTLEQVVYQLERRKSNGAHPNDGGWND